MGQSVIYEITVTVRGDIIEKYEEYMRRRHIPDLLATGYFRAADFSRSTAATETAAGRYRVRYEAFDQNALDKYLERDAARLREDFIRHFLAGVEVSREVWEVLEFWKNE